MKSFLAKNLLALFVLVLTSVVLYDTFRPGLTTANCGVRLEIRPGAYTEDPQSPDFFLVPLQLVNTTGNPVRFVGETACWGIDLDFGSKSLPYSFDTTDEFNLSAYRKLLIESPENPITFDLYLEVTKSDLLFSRKGLVVFNVELKLDPEKFPSPAAGE